MKKEGYKVLIVEDDIPLQQLYGKKFAASGYTVVTADDGEKALEVATSENPDIVLLDLMLPVMNGFEVLKKMKSKDELKNIPVVILSNYGEMPNITEGMLCGAAEYLIKVEHTPEEVVDVINDVLKNKGSIVGEAFRETA